MHLLHLPSPAFGVGLVYDTGIMWCLSFRPCPAWASVELFLIPVRTAVGFLALVAAAQLAVLQGSSAALQCREHLASAERLMIPALAIFFYLSQVRDICHISPSLWPPAQTAVRRCTASLHALTTRVPFIRHARQPLVPPPGMAVPSRFSLLQPSSPSQDSLLFYLSCTWTMSAVAHDEGGCLFTSRRQALSSGGMTAQAAVHVAMAAGVLSVLSGCIEGNLLVEQVA